jgi:hypothetical protein
MRKKVLTCVGVSDNTFIRFSAKNWRFLNLKPCYDQLKKASKSLSKKANSFGETT